MCDCEVKVVGEEILMVVMVQMGPQLSGFGDFSVEVLHT